MNIILYFYMEIYDVMTLIAKVYFVTSFQKWNPLVVVKPSL